jgi:hypothetical protein
VGVVIGLGVKAAVGLGLGSAIGSRVGVTIGSKAGVGVNFGCSVNVSVGSGVEVAIGLAAGVGTGDSSGADGLLCLKGVEAASCARTNGEAARNTVAIVSKRMMLLRLSTREEISQIEASPRSSRRSSRIDLCFNQCSPALARSVGGLRDDHVESVGLSTHLPLNLPTSCDTLPSSFAL